MITRTISAIEPIPTMLKNVSMPKYTHTLLYLHLQTADPKGTRRLSFQKRTNMDVIKLQLVFGRWIVYEDGN